MRSFVEKVIPLYGMLADYDPGTFRRDLAAGLTVGVMLIPQSMAYAMLAGLPPRYGLYAGFVPLLVYPFLGSSRHLSVGPVAIDMLIVAAGVGAVAGGPQEHVELAILVAAMTGLIEILMGVLRFGFFVNFLSRPVIAGFMTAAPLIIAASQLDNLMGVELVESQYVHLKIYSALRHLGEANLVTLGVGVSGIVILAALERWRPNWPSALIWVILATLATWFFDLQAAGLAIVQDVPSEIPFPRLPDWSLSTLVDLAPTAVTLALVQFMSVVSLGQAFASDHDYSIDANRELFAIGASNLFGSFFRSMPVSGSFSRSAVNNRAGAETPVTNLVAASLVGLALLFLTPLFFYLPDAALAAIIIVACVGMVDVPELRRLLETRWIDGGVALATFAATLGIGIQQGILIGIGLSIVVILYDLTRPDLVELGHMPGTHDFRDLSRNPEAERIPGLYIVRIDSRFSFANAQTLIDELLAEIEGDEPVRAVVLETSGVNDLDTTAVRALEDLVEELTEAGIELYVAGAKGTIRDVLHSSGLVDQLGSSNFYLNTHHAVSDILEDWDEAEHYDPTDQQKRRREMTAAREKLEEERERLKEDRREMLRERRRLNEELDHHERERDELDEQRQSLRQRLEDVKRRRNELEETRRKLAEDRREIEQREQKLEERSRELKEKQRDLEEHEERLEAERNALDTDKADLERERDRLLDEIEERTREKEDLEKTRQALEEELDRALERREELREQREQLREEREQLEAERRRLEAERDKATGEDDEPD